MLNKFYEMSMAKRRIAMMDEGSAPIHGEHYTSPVQQIKNAEAAAGMPDRIAGIDTEPPAVQPQFGRDELIDLIAKIEAAIVPLKKQLSTQK